MLVGSRETSWFLKAQEKRCEEAGCQMIKHSFHYPDSTVHASDLTHFSYHHCKIQFLKRGRKYDTGINKVVPINIINPGSTKCFLSILWSPVLFIKEETRGTLVV